MKNRSRPILIFYSSAILTLCLISSALGSGKGLAGTPINIGAGIDVVLDGSLSDPAQSDFEFRAFELNIGAPVDPYFNMVATLGYHDGEFDLEEAWISAILPLNFKLLFGRELLPFGYLNRIHEHDYPQVDQPFMREELISHHGFIGEGGHLEYLAPFANPTLSLTVGFYRRLLDDIGLRIDGYPLLARAQSYIQSPGGSHAILLGASYLTGVAGEDFLEDHLIDGRITDPAAIAKIRSTLGFDVKYRWSPGGQTSRGLILGSEYMRLDYVPYENHVLYETDPDFEPGFDQGLYAYAHWNHNRYWGFGYRYDLTDVLYNRLEDEAKITAHSIYGEWRPTEFSRLRLQYQTVRDGREDEAEHKLMLQGTFLIGWHPPHRF